MQRTEVTIVYEDDTVDDDLVLIRLVGLAAAERHLNGLTKQLNCTLFAAWHQLGRPGGPSEAKFDTWLETLSVDTRERTFDPKSERSSEASPTWPSPQG